MPERTDVNGCQELGTRLLCPAGDFPGIGIQHAPVPHRRFSSTRVRCKPRLGQSWIQCGRRVRQRLFTVFLVLGPRVAWCFVVFERGQASRVRPTCRLLTSTTDLSTAESETKPSRSEKSMPICSASPITLGRYAARPSPADPQPGRAFRESRVDFLYRHLASSRSCSLVGMMPMEPTPLQFVCRELMRLKRRTFGSLALGTWPTGM